MTKSKSRKLLEEKLRGQIKTLKLALESKNHQIMILKDHSKKVKTDDPIFRNFDIMDKKDIIDYYEKLLDEAGDRYNHLLIEYKKVKKK